MSEPRIFESRFYAGVRQRLSGPGRQELVKHMQYVMSQDRVARSLDNPHPAERIYFGASDNSDRTKVYEIIGVSEADLKQAVHDSPVVDAKWHVGTNEFNWAMVLALKALVETNARQEDVRLAVAFFGTHHMAYLVSHFFKFYNQNIMDYAINTLSDKFILKKEGTLFKMMMSICWRSHEKYVALLKKGDDKSLMSYFINMRTRLFGVIKTFRQHYGRVMEQGAYLNKAREYHDDGQVRHRESDSGRINTIATVATERFVGDPSDERLLSVSSKLADVPRVSLSTAVNSMRRSENDLLRDSFSTILELFFDERKASVQDIRSRQFFDFCLAVYARSNTKDGRVEKIKANLNKLLERHSEAYASTNREATKGNLRKAIYVYMCLFLQANSPGA